MQPFLLTGSRIITQTQRGELKLSRTYVQTALPVSDNMIVQRKEQRQEHYISSYEQHSWELLCHRETDDKHSNVSTVFPISQHNRMI